MSDESLTVIKLKLKISSIPKMINPSIYVIAQWNFKCFLFQLTALIIA